MNCHHVPVPTSDPSFEQRPWGSFAVLDDQASHKVKRIEVDSGNRLSYQQHERRAEQWIVVDGVATVTLDDVEHELGAGQTIRIERGAKHRVENRGSTGLVFIEVQTGDYFGEDDIMRLSDDYGRADGGSPAK